MKYYILALTSCLALASCTRPPATHPPQSEPIGLDTSPPDTSADREFVRINSANPAENGSGQAPVKLHLFPSDAGSTPQEVVRRRLFGLPPPKKVVSSPEKVASDNLTGYKLPRKCKGCVFNTVAGNQTVAGKKAQVAAGDGTAVVVTAKKAGPVVLADSGAHVGIVGSGIAQAGDGNTASMPAPLPEPNAWDKWKAGVASVWATAKGPLLGLGIIVAVAGGIHFFAPASAAALWLAGLVRRRKPADNQA